MKYDNNLGCFPLHVVCRSYMHHISPYLVHYACIIMINTRLDLSTGIPVLRIRR